MGTKKAPRAKDRAARDEAMHEPLPTWRNTRPRGNPEIDKQDFERGRARWETLLGR